MKNKDTKSQDTKSQAAEAKAPEAKAPEAEAKAELTLDEEIALLEAKKALLVEKKTAQVKAARESQKSVLQKVINDAIGVAYDSGKLTDFSLLATPYANFTEVFDDGVSTGVIAEIEERSAKAATIRASAGKKNGESKKKTLAGIGTDARKAQDCFKASGGTLTIRQIKERTGLTNGGQITNVLNDVGWKAALESNPGVPRCDVTDIDD